MEYTTRLNRRAKRTFLTVYPDGSVVVTMPRKISASVIDAFVREKSSWIQETRARRIENLPTHAIVRLKHTEKEITEYKKEALLLVTARLAYFNARYKHHFTRIVIRNQKTRWGSCSRSGTLSFNYRIVLLPPDLADYVIVHELCHLKQMNHSPRFWALVEKTIPDHKERRRALRTLQP